MSEPGLLVRHVGADALALFIGGVQLSLDDVGPVTIRHGRRTVDEQPNPATCSFTLHAAALPALPEIGDYVAVDLGDSAAAEFGLVDAALAAATHRFIGTISDVTFIPARGAHGTPLVSVVAVSLRARLGRADTGLVDWPMESDGARALRIVDELDTPTGLTRGVFDPGTVDVQPRPADTAKALDLLDQLAADAGAVLAELRDGTLEWHDAEHRRGAIAAVDLTAAQVLADMTPTQKLAGLVNDLTTSYAGGSTRLIDTDSTDPITGYGPLRSSIATQLAEQADAESLALLILGRRSRPTWDIGDGLPVDLLRSVDNDTAAALLQLEFADLLRVVDFPAEGPFELRQLWVEGWTEVITRHRWTLQLAVSDLELTGPAARWTDGRDPDQTWAGADAEDNRRWLDLIGYRTAYGHGLWVDIAAADRWATHAASLQTWAEADAAT